jgi:gamma-glutamyltranspeptidase/glutathione hydrolase
MPQIGYAHRQAPMGRRGMVAACHPLASLAGVDVLKSGGNVVDAAVATNAVLAVTQPNFCGVGGDIFCLYYEAATKRVHFLNGAGRSGARATLDELGRRGLTAVPGVGPGSVSVPGATRGWRMLLDRFGTRPLASLLEPAIHYAGEGFPLSDVVAQAIREKAPAADDAEWRRVFVPGDKFPQTGDCFRQPDLARTLTDLGGEPELFYKGRVARAIADRMAREGFLTAEDLAAHEGEWGAPISSTYRGYTVYETPPPTQGLAALLTLNLLEGFDLTRHEIHSPEHLHLLIEMTKLASADRNRWIADPPRAVPVEASEQAFAEKRRRVRRCGAGSGAAPRRHHRLRGRRRAGQCAECHPESLPELRRGRGAARHRRGVAESGRVLQPRSRASQRLRSGQARSHLLPPGDREGGDGYRPGGDGRLFTCFDQSSTMDEIRSA